MSDEFVTVTVAGVGLLALGSQWLAWRVKLPAILFLLASGIVVGPLLGWLRPDELFGDLLLPLVSASVAVILFEGALTLNFNEVRNTVRVVQLLVTVGAAITWGVIAVATHFLLEFSWSMALLFGAITVVSGPTVIVPLLRAVRPSVAVANILRWEGIIIDPIGALLAVVVYEFIVSQSQRLALGASLVLFLQVVTVGMSVGYLAGRAVGEVLARRWLPEYLHNLLTLSTVLVVFAGSNALAHEAGLLAVTVMGMVLANLPQIRIGEILHFKENLTIVLISGLFILLAARLNLLEIVDLGSASILLVVIIQFVARPLTVLASTIGSPLSWRERLLLSWIAPRGIVAAAIAALFAFKLTEYDFAGAKELVPLTFLVIISTVVLQGGTARIVASLLGVAEPAPKGFLIIGANVVARGVARMLTELGYRVTLTDSSWENIRAARMDNLVTFFGNPISAYADRNLDLVGIGHVLSLSPHRELNVASSMRFRHEFGHENVYLLLTSTDTKVSEKHQVAQEHQGEVLFSRDISFNKLASMISKGGELKKTKLSETFTYEDYLKQDKTAVPMFAMSPKGQLVVRSVGRPFQPEAGWVVIGVSDKVSVAEKAVEKNQEKQEKRDKPKNSDVEGEEPSSSDAITKDDASDSTTDSSS